jgi:hypothetical protein
MACLELHHNAALGNNIRLSAEAPLDGQRTIPGLLRSIYRRRLSVSPPPQETGGLSVNQSSPSDFVMSSAKKAQMCTASRLHRALDWSVSHALGGFPTTAQIAYIKRPGDIGSTRLRLELSLRCAAGKCTQIQKAVEDIEKVVGCEDVQVADRRESHEDIAAAAATSQPDGFRLRTDKPRRSIYKEAFP